MRLRVLLAAVTLLALGASALTPTGVTVWNYEAGDHLKLGVRDSIVLLVSFDSDFDDSRAGACNPVLLLNAAPGRGNAAMWEPRSKVITFPETNPAYARLNALEAPAGNTLAFVYTVSYGDYAPALDLASPRESSLSANASCQLSFDFSNVASLPAISPVYSVSTVPAVPLSIRANKIGMIRKGQRLDITLSFDRAVTVLPAPPPPATAPSVIVFDSADESAGSGAAQTPPDAPSDSVTPTSLTLNNGGKANFVGLAKDDPKEVLFAYIPVDGDDVDPLDVDWSKGITIGSVGLQATDSGISLDDAAVYVNQPNLTLSPDRLNRVYVSTGKQRFPPADYDPLSVPFLSGPSRLSGPTMSPVQVKVLVDVRSVYQVDDKTQSFKADVVRKEEWFDGRFKSSRLLEKTDVSRSALSKIWHPFITFDNARGELKFTDFRCTVYNNGTVHLSERVPLVASAPWDARKFPWDSQKLSIVLRSSKYDSSYVTFVTVPGANATSRPEILPPSDGNWNFPSISQSVTVTKSSLIYINYALLSTDVIAQRISTFGVALLLIPLMMICALHVCCFLFPLKADSRTTVAATGFISSLTFNFVVNQIAPPVGYLTKISYCALFTIIFSLLNLIIQSIFRNIYSATEMLSSVSTPKPEAVQPKKEEAGYAPPYVPLLEMGQEPPQVKDPGRPITQTHILFGKMKINHKNKYAHIVPVFA
jgi:gamma-aminobutyric acid receptor subunit beta